MKQTKTKHGTIWRDPKTGECVISDAGGWLPGAYENQEAASLALEQASAEDYHKLQRLQDEANKRNGGTGGVITCADLSASSWPFVMLAISGCAIITSLAAWGSGDDGGQMMCFGMLAQAVGQLWIYGDGRRAKSRQNSQINKQKLDL